MSSSVPIKTICEEISNGLGSSEHIYHNLAKIFNYLKNSDKYQKDIFLNLSDKGLNQILSLMRDKNENIRKLSFIVLINLLYNNDVLQNIFCEKYNFNPIGNVICINWLPSFFKEKVKMDINLINELKRNSSMSNIQNSQTKYWQWPNNSKYTDEILPDPERYLLGFFYSNKSNNNIINSIDVNNNYDTQSIIDLLEENYTPSPLKLPINDIIGNSNLNKPTISQSNKIKEEFKKSKVKGASRSIDFKNMKK